jgi:hypothetical protein
MTNDTTWASNLGLHPRAEILPDLIFNLVLCFSEQKTEVMMGVTTPSIAPDWESMRWESVDWQRKQQWPSRPLKGHGYN